MIEGCLTNVVADFLCERRNRLNLSLNIKRIQVVGPRFRAIDLSFWLVRQLWGATLATVRLLLSEKGSSLKGLRSVIRTPRPESGLDYLVCAIFLGQW